MEVKLKLLVVFSVPVMIRKVEKHKKAESVNTQSDYETMSKK